MNANQVRQHLATDATCAVCGHGYEDTDHILRKCFPALSIWSNIIKPTSWDECIHSNIQDWIVSNIMYPSLYMTDHSNWETKFGFICWLPWNRMNNKLFNENFIEQGTRLSDKASDKELAGTKGRRLDLDRRATKESRAMPAPDANAELALSMQKETAIQLKNVVLGCTHNQKNFNIKSFPSL
ncbi:hypothetical protein J1N35_004059 [Gossypium stocksii]|uniref:Reverse transcriptase zinc-binding domain-containing protein n=1 Tax=Gossypium stocksii TaxID=47602 RepID=A0A9D3WAD5_9ROSI|nr:hypothetical protein J1N35_004059 [Gossypium stocksii]